MRKVIHPNFPEYFIREDGLVERRVDSSRYQKAGDILQGRILVSGYRQYKLVSKDGPRLLVRANRLVTEAFHGPPPTPSHHSAHKNGDKLDNRPNNLYWATAKQNKADALRHGTMARGSRVGTSKLTDAQVAEIKRAYDGTRGSITALAGKYGVGLSAISRIIDGEGWKHVNVCVCSRRQWDRLSFPERERLVSAFAKNGARSRDAAQALGIAPRTVAEWARRAQVSFAGRPGRSAYDRGCSSA